jgi:microcystin-dependent protein
MPTNTPGRALPVAALPDVPDANVLASQLATALDRVLSGDGGTLASRPAASAAIGTAIGRPFTFYWASDTSQLFFSFGGAWIDLSGASGPPIPLGASLEYAGSGDPSDSRFLLEDGRALARAGQYAPLFGVLSTTYGAGDGSTTFNIPDSRGRATVSPDNMGTGTGAAGRLPNSPSGRGNVGGSELHAHAGSSPDHTHYVPVQDHLHAAGSLYTADHAHGGGSIFVSGHSRGWNIPTASGALEAVAFANSVSGVGGGATAGSGNIAIGGYTGASDRSLPVYSYGADRSLAFTTSSVSTLQPYVVKNKIIRVR